MTLSKTDREKLAADAPVGAFAAGPRNLPKPSERKRLRKQRSNARRRNRNVYSGQ